MKDKSVEAKRKRWEEANKNYWADICTGELTKESLDKHTKEVGDRTGQGFSFDEISERNNPGEDKLTSSKYFKEALRNAMFSSEHDCKYPPKTAKGAEYFDEEKGIKYTFDGRCWVGDMEQKLKRQLMIDRINHIRTGKEYRPKFEGPIEGFNDLTMLTFLSAYANKLSSHDMYMALKECKAILNEDGSLDIECPNDIIQSTISDYAEDSDRHYIAKYFGNNAWDFGLTIKGDEVYVGYDKGEGGQGVTEKVLLIKDTEGDIAKVFLDGGKFSLYLTIEAGGLYDISFSLEKVVALKKFLNDNIKD